MPLSMLWLQVLFIVTITVIIIIEDLGHGKETNGENIDNEKRLRTSNL